MASKNAYISPSVTSRTVSMEQYVCVSDSVQAGSIADITEIERTGDWNDD